MRPCVLAVVVVAASILPLPMGAQAVGQPPPQRTYPVLRLRPTAFPELPKNLITELKRRGCTVPQPYTSRKANVIRGEFAKPGQTDWAVLCSASGYSSILVFRDRSEHNPAEIAKWPEADGTVIYDHFINPVGRKFIMDTYRAYGGPKPLPIDHQGIESGGEMASVRAVLLSGQVGQAARGGLICGPSLRLRCWAVWRPSARTPNRQRKRSHRRTDRSRASMIRIAGSGIQQQSPPVLTADANLALIDVQISERERKK